jgi:hypothetical protein
MIKSASFFLLYVWVFFFLKTENTYAQSHSTKKQSNTTSKSSTSNQTLMSDEELIDYKKRVASIVSFYEFALNTIGNDSTAAEDKDVIINRSYLKFFVNNKVQVEDDLDENRLVKTFKPIQAYLQDVDYFFKYVQFTLNIEEIKHYFDNPQQPYFKVTLTRFIKGTSSKGDTIFNSKKRYIEVNLDVKQKDIKIASIYTTPLNEEEEQLSWWNSMPEVWKQVFRKEMGGSDSLNLGQIKRLQNTQEIDVSGNTAIIDLSPLSRIGALRVLKLSNTAVYDITPIRNLTNLEVLKLDGTLVKNIQALQFATKIKELDMSFAKLDSTLDLAKFSALEKFSCVNCGLTNLKFLEKNRALTQLMLGKNAFKNLTGIEKASNLVQLDISSCPVSDIDYLSGLKKLEMLNMSATNVVHLSHLEELVSLKKVYLTESKIQTLENLKALANIEKIYCDNTAIGKEEALAFMKSKPSCLVIFESARLHAWWQNLSTEWQNIFKFYVKIQDKPTQEQLVVLVNQDEIDLKENREIKDLEPLKVFYKLQKLYAQNTSIQDLTPLSDCIQLELLHISGSKVSSLLAIEKLSTIKTLYIENTKLDSIKINQYRNRQVKTNVIYRTASVRSWWTDVPDNWRMVFQKYIPYNGFPNDEQLHAMMAIDSINISNQPNLNTLKPVQSMDRIRFLKIENAKITDMQPIKNSNTLLELNLTKNPIKDISPLTGLSQLQILVLENTGVSELEPLANLSELNHLNLSGTQIKELDNLEKCNSLKFLDISSTVISSLKAIEAIKSLENLKCFNTKLTDKKISKFKTLNPNCEVVFY